MKRTATIAAVAFLIEMIVLGSGCGWSGPQRTPLRQSVAGRVAVGSEWTEVAPPQPIAATSRFHFLGLRIANASGWADDRREAIRFSDGKAVRIEIELVEADGNVTKLYPNGFAELVEFGKRTENRDRPEEAEFRVGSKFAKVRLRSDKSVDIQELVWMEFDL
jgi:hypothetical protein